MIHTVMHWQLCSGTKDKTVVSISAKSKLLTFVAGTQSGIKRRSPLQPASEPTAKKGRLQLKRENSDEQSDPDFMAGDSSPAPKRKPAGRANRSVESDEDCSQTSPIQGILYQDCLSDDWCQLC